MYIANAVFAYNGKQYQAGMTIPDFGVGKYDDILLESGQVVSDGVGTGVEDKIANLSKWRKDHMTDLDAEQETERKFMADARRYEAARDLKIAESAN